jgi:predicted 2-oxoglutarate/Fe(II)-dependent dioxygenase YbiX
MATFDGKVCVVNAVATSEELAAISAWALSRVAAGDFKNARTETGTTAARITNSHKTDSQYPAEIYNIRQRLISTYNLQDALLLNYATDGIVVSLIYDGGDVFRHKDTFLLTGDAADTAVLRCNLLVSAAETGGDVIVDDTIYPLQPGDVIMYPSTDYDHEVTTCHGTAPRILVMFGFLLPAGVWQTGQYVK